MTTALTIRRATTALTPSSGLVVLFLVAFGWFYSFMQLNTLDSVGSLSEAGPGMQMFAAIQYYLLNNPLGFETSLNFCTTTNANWDILDFVKSFAMWVAMVAAMMLPNLFPLLKSIKARGEKAIPFVLGYFAIWSGFCMLGVSVQWALRMLDVLNGHMVITNPMISATVLCVAGTYQLSQKKVARLKERKNLMPITDLKPCCQTVETASGTAYGLACVRCCFPLMLTMFAFGLMNILAMAMLTVMMILETYSDSRINLAKFWGSVMCSMGLLFYLLAV
jgi:predicted metal-binding membrane protein